MGTRENPRHYVHIPGTCDVISDAKPGEVWSRGVYYCNRPIKADGKCGIHLGVEKRVATVRANRERRRRLLRGNPRII